MKFLFLIFSIFFCSYSLSAQENIIAKTSDGKSVILKNNGTWIYVDSSNISDRPADYCDLDAIVEVKGRKDGGLAMVEARLSDLKKHISVDLECDIKEIKVIAASEQKGNGAYNVCACSKKVKYKKMGSVFMRDGQKLF